MSMRLLVLLLMLAWIPNAHGQDEPEQVTVEDAPAEESYKERDPFSVAFFKALRQGDAAEVERLLARGSDPNIESGGTPVLVIAVQAGNSDSVRALLDAGAEIDADDGNQYTALHYAARAGNVKMLELLLARGADVNKPGYDDHTVLMFAVHGAMLSGTPVEVRAMLREGDDEERLVPENFGTIEDYRQVLRKLISAGAEVNTVADCGETALTMSPGTFDPEIVKILLVAGARVDYGWSPLCMLRESPDATLRELVPEEPEGVEDKKRYEELKKAVHQWDVKTAPARQEIINLLMAAGATPRNCGDEKDENKQE